MLLLTSRVPSFLSATPEPVNVLLTTSIVAPVRFSIAARPLSTNVELLTTASPQFEIPPVNGVLWLVNVLRSTVSIEAVPRLAIAAPAPLFASFRSKVTWLTLSVP